MKKTVTIILAASLLCVAASGQESGFKSRYERQVRMVGYSGVGVENILDHWQEAEPDNTDMLEGRYNYYLSKSVSSSVVPKSKPKYLGGDPVITLKDSTGRDVYYFEENFFVDSLFANSLKAADRAIALEPDELAWRINKINALLLYEKESPELAAGEIESLIDYQAAKHPAWTLRGEAPSEDIFLQAVQEYCYTLFRIGTPVSYEAFRSISERMLKLYPKDPGFMGNLGSYYLVCKGSPKQARKWYEKVLKVAPDDYTAARNCVLIARREKDEKMEKKYLPVLIRATEDEIERQGYEARLAALGNKKK